MNGSPDLRWLLLLEMDLKNHINVLDLASDFDNDQILLIKS